MAADGFTTGGLPEFVVGAPELTVDGGVKAGVASDSGVKALVAGDTASGTLEAANHKRGEKSQYL